MPLARYLLRYVAISAGWPSRPIHGLNGFVATGGQTAESREAGGPFGLRVGRRRPGCGKHGLGLCTRRRRRRQQAHHRTQAGPPRRRGDCDPALVCDIGADRGPTQQIGRATARDRVSGAKYGPGRELQRQLHRAHRYRTRPCRNHCRPARSQVGSCRPGCGRPGRDRPELRPARGAGHTHGWRPRSPRSPGHRGRNRRRDARGRLGASGPTTTDHDHQPRGVVALGFPRRRASARRPGLPPGAKSGGIVMSRDSTRLRMSVLGVVVVSLFAALLTRLWYLEVLAPPSLRQEATANAVRVVESQVLECGSSTGTEGSSPRIASCSQWSLTAMRWHADQRSWAGCRASCRSAWRSSRSAWPTSGTARTARRRSPST